MTLTVARVPMSAREKLRVSLRESDGAPLLELRVWETVDGHAAGNGKFVQLPAEHALPLAKGIMRAVRCAMVGEGMRS